LGVMTPREIREVRQRRAASRKKFSEVTGIGEASLGRWESGAQVISQGMNSLLRLLEYGDNYSWLEATSRAVHKTTHTEPVTPGSDAGGRQARTRALVNVEEARVSGLSFTLRSSRTSVMAA
jgi:transcriptional regulator with XRE-family HTH domain